MLSARVNIFEPINNFQYGPAAFTQTTLGTTDNTYASTLSPGTLSRVGAAYVLDLPFHGFEPDLGVNLDVTMHVRAVANLLPGDVNFDGVVNAADRAVIQANWGQSDPHGLRPGDANGDGIVNANDMELVPEPATLLPCAVGFAMLMIATRFARHRHAPL